MLDADSENIARVRYDCTAHGTLQPQPGARPAPLISHPDLELPAGPPGGADSADNGGAADPADVAGGYVPECGLTEREWRLFSSAVRVCGNDYKAVAALCTLQEAGETRLTAERVREIMLGIRCAPRRRRLAPAAWKKSAAEEPQFATAP